MAQHPADPQPLLGVPTAWLVDVIASDLRRLCSPHGVLRWTDVERHLARIAEEARGAARRSRGTLLSLIASN